MKPGRMIIFRILARDLRRNRGTMLLVFAFVTLSALLVAGGTGLIVTLNGALDTLFHAARVPDVVQMHSGTIDVDALDAWVSSRDEVEEYQVDEMISIDGSALYLAEGGESEEGSVMDISFVRQNESFDLLLDEENRPYYPEPGTIGIPFYFAERDGLSLGDTVTLETGDFERTFTAAARIRDAQMNPAIVHSKRFVVHEDDFAVLREAFPETEYLISFRLVDPALTDGFTAAYRDAGLPQSGPMVGRTLFRTLNALSDGIVSAVVILLSGILMVIALLCLRFSILASIEEDYREIGVMKAIGMPDGRIRSIYVAKYVAVALLASVAGFLASFPLTDMLTRQMSRSLGQAHSGLTGIVLPVCAAILVFAVVVVSCLIILRRLRKITAVAALRSFGVEASRERRIPRLQRWRGVSINTALGLRDVMQRPRLYVLLAFIFFFAAFIIIVPFNFLTTITARSFVSYMGIGRSDIRIDLRRSDVTAERHAELERILAEDPAVARYASLVTSLYTLVTDSGEEESFPIETGDISLFPPDYLKGGSPRRSNEIALSYLNAREMDRDVGDTVTLVINDRHTDLTVSGIYQDVTNGGRTAKALVLNDPERLLSYSFALDVVPETEVHEKSLEYSVRFAPARVTDLKGYMSQTLGTTIDSLRTVTIVALFVGLGVSVLVTSLFLHMLIRKDVARNSVLRWIGFSLKDIRHQYQITILAVLGVGLSLGTLFSNTVGEELVSFLWSFMGAARIDFVVAPLTAYLALPVTFALTVLVTTRINASGIKTATSGGTL